MEAHLNVNQTQHKVPKKSTSLFDLLVTLTTGMLGMITALFGIYSDITTLVIGGTIVFVAAGLSVIAKSGISILEFLSAYQDFKDRFKKKNNSDISE